MPEFSKTSRQRLETCDKRLITLCREAILVVDFTVLCGHRSKEEQDELYAQGRTKPGKIVTHKRGGESIHNTFPSRAVDLAPWPIDWNDLTRFGELAGVMKAIAHDMMIPLQWGGDWPNFPDRPHFQLPA